MPKIKLSFTDESSIPDSLKAFKAADNSVEVWVGDKVAEETNATLAANRDTIKGEKDTLQTKYDNLLTSSADTNRQLLEERAKSSQAGDTVNAEERAILNAVKEVAPTAKPDVIKNQLKKYPELEVELDTIKTAQTNKDFFALSGFKSESVFLDLVASKEKNPNLEKLFAKEETVDGKVVKKLYAVVKQESGSAKDVLFETYVKENAEWTPYLPALAGGQSTNEWMHQAPGAEPQTHTPAGMPKMDDYIAKQNEKAKAVPNPLLPNLGQPASAEAIQN